MKNKKLSLIAVVTASLIMSGCDNNDSNNNASSAKNDQPSQAEVTKKAAEVAPRTYKDSDFTQLDSGLKCLNLYTEVAEKSPDESYAFLIKPQELSQKKDHFERADYIKSLSGEIANLQSSEKVNKLFSVTIPNDDRKLTHVMLTQYIDANEPHVSRGSAKNEGKPGFQILLFSPSGGSGEYKRYSFDSRNGYGETSNCEVGIPGGYESLIFMPVTDESIARKISKYVSDDKESKKLSVKYFMEANSSNYVGNDGVSNRIPLTAVFSKLIKVQLLYNGEVINEYLAE